MRLKSIAFEIKGEIFERDRLWNMISDWLDRHHVTRSDIVSITDLSHQPGGHVNIVINASSMDRSAATEDVEFV